MLNSTPFESGKKGEEESEFEAEKRSQARTVYVTGRTGMTVNEASKLIIEEARNLLQKDLGMKIDFDDPDLSKFLIH